MATHTEVLIVGGGFAGIACAQRLERLLGKATSITLLSTENYFVFQPLLPEVVGASLSPQHVISPLRHLLRRTTVVRSQVQQILLAPLGAPEAGTVIAQHLAELLANGFYHRRRLLLLFGQLLSPLFF